VTLGDFGAHSIAGTSIDVEPSAGRPYDQGAVVRAVVVENSHADAGLSIATAMHEDTPRAAMEDTMTAAHTYARRLHALQQGQGECSREAHRRKFCARLDAGNKIAASHLLRVCLRFSPDKSEAALSTCPWTARRGGRPHGGESRTPPPSTSAMIGDLARVRSLDAKRW
jgi:hypothetical protein